MAQRLLLNNGDNERAFLSLSLFVTFGTTEDLVEEVICPMFATSAFLFFFYFTSCLLPAGSLLKRSVDLPEDRLSELFTPKLVVALSRCTAVRGGVGVYSANILCNLASRLPERQLSKFFTHEVIAVLASASADDGEKGESSVGALCNLSICLPEEQLPASFAREVVIALRSATAVGGQKGEFAARSLGNLSACGVGNF